MRHFLSALAAAPGARFHLANETSGRLVSVVVEPAFTSGARRHGLLQRDALDPDTAMVLAPCGAIHTCLMRFPIDVVFVSRDGTVAKVCARVRPWRAAFAWGAFAAIELVAGGADRSHTAVGDRLRLISPSSDDGHVLEFLS
jgi:uncharacterized membrane protein (UPF0127 family)